MFIGKYFLDKDCFFGIVSMSFIFVALIIFFTFIIIVITIKLM